MLPVKTILCPTDLSERSEFALRLACSLAADYGARLIVLHVAEPVAAVYADPPVLPFVEPSRESLRTELHEFVRRNTDATVEERLVDGAATNAILRIADETQCDLIVMGTHGRTGFDRVLMGSVAEVVVRKAPCPVLTVKTPVHSSRTSGRDSHETRSSPVAAVK